jgi:hypothetical protein
MYWVPAVALTIGLVSPVAALTVAGVAMLVRLLLWPEARAVPGVEPDPGGGTGTVSGLRGPFDDGGKPAWWPRFEPELHAWAVAREGTRSRSPAEAVRVSGTRLRREGGGR